MEIFSKEPVERFRPVVEQMVEFINKEIYSNIEENFAKVMLDAFPLEKSKSFFKKLISSAGKIKKLGTARFIPPNQAVFPAHFERTVLDIKIVLDGDNKIIGLWFLPHSPAISVSKDNSTILELPFEDTWMVFWGGDTKEQNYHHDTPNQKYLCLFICIS
jgi:hypothetical protein